MNCGFCGDLIHFTEDYFVHKSGEMRHEDCGQDVAKEEPGDWTHSDDLD